MLTPRTRSVSLVFLVLLALSCSSKTGTTRSPTAGDATLQPMLDAALVELGVDGASVVMIRHDGTRQSIVSGVADRSGTRVTESTKFAIASVTKTFTTVVA